MPNLRLLSVSDERSFKRILILSLHLPSLFVIAVGRREGRMPTIPPPFEIETWISKLRFCLNSNSLQKLLIFFSKQSAQHFGHNWLIFKFVVLFWNVQAISRSNELVKLHLFEKNSTKVAFFYFIETKIIPNQQYLV